MGRVTAGRDRRQGQWLSGRLDQALPGGLDEDHDFTGWNQIRAGGGWL